MRTTIDRAGRMVIPKALRETVGLLGGEVEVTVEGAGLRLEPVVEEGFEARGDWLAIPSGDLRFDDELVRALRDADRR